ncbi:MAG: RHS repeat-associated core domain-containing protein [Actinophytocola sp.]|uniref:RHS repeat-associated core domain-containing protein n=1 Tax=Actinophytocola sp. TaxID=1872138 RepID=UPI003C71E776
MRLPRPVVRAVTIVWVVALSASIVQGAAAEPRPEPDRAPAAQQERRVPMHPIEVPPTDRGGMPKPGPSTPVRWPAAAKSEVDLPAATARRGVEYQRAGDLPVRVGRAGETATTAAAPAAVTVETFGQAAAKKANVPGTLLRVTGAAGGKVSVEVDYAGFGQAYGGDYGSRLYLARYPACVLTTPERAECLDATPLPSTNHAGNRTVSAEITMAPAGKTDAGTVLAVQAGDAGSGGTYAATDLAPSGSWTAGGSSGDFTYSVPLSMPPVPGGLAPQVSFGYASGSLDGRTSSTNSQASWVGDGWDLSAGGFIERTYTSCADDEDGNQGDLQTGDLCWKNERYRVSIAGISGKLVKDGDGWRPERDDGSRLEKLADTATGNGDDNGEYWKITSPDGTQYFLGRNRLPGWTSGKAETQSVFTVPVYGNHAGEPCYKPAFADSACTQAYRWNVDLVIDPLDNAMSYYYDKEFNYYKRGGVQGVNTQYVAAGKLARVEYGLRSDALYATAPARVVFQPAARCTAGDTTCDVPTDRICNSGEDCTSRYSPAFFSRSKLVKAATQAYTSGEHRNVDSWTLRHTLPPTGDGEPRALWLAGITRTGHVGGTASLPEIRFSGLPMDNRVDTVDTLLPLTRYRITRIDGVAGAVTEVTYAEHECSRTGTMPNRETNTLRCYPTWWTPQGAQDPIEDWFHKYVVTDVVEDSRTGGPSLSKTHYDYLDGGAWHYDDNIDGEAKDRTWSEWRGYGRVRTTVGDANEPRTVSETRYLRGMDGDHRSAGPHDEWVTDGDGGRIEDIPALEGFTLETLLYSNGHVVSADVNTPNVIQTASDGTFTANIVGTKAVVARTLQENGTWRKTRSTTTFTGEGLPLTVNEDGDIAVTGDEACTEATYARNESDWMLNYASKVHAIAKPCSALPGTADDVVSDVTSAFDGQDVGQAPTKGVPTATNRWTGGTAYQKVSGEVTDAYGRTTQSTDIDGKTTITTYTPATGNPTTVTTKNRVGWTSTSTLDPIRGLPVTEVGVNRERSDLEYDPLGRLVRVWAPGWSKADYPTKPTTEYSYEYRLDAPTVVTTKTLKEDETYAVSYDLYDGLLRLRQSQTPASGGGRIVSDVFYNSRGLQAKVNGGYFNPNAPSKDLSGAFDNEVPNQTVTVFDDLGRPLETIFKRLDVEVSRTKTRYAGDTTYTTPPEGDTPTAVFKDALGRIVERRQYHARSADGVYPANAPYDAMTYRYNAKGLPDRVTDAQGNQWRYEYDQLGRKKVAVDPDRGRTTFGYNAVDQLESTTDARDEKLVYTYDDLGRATALYDGVVGDDTKLATWTYDTLRKGLPTSATRYVGGHEYTQKVDQYDNLGRPTSVSVVIPPVEGKLAGTYSYRTSYSSVTGQLRSETLPKVGELAQETVVHEYDQDGLPLKSHGQNTYASEHLYSPYGESLRVTLGASPNKVWVNATYEEGTRRLANFEIRRDKTVQPQVANRTFGYDQAGNITKIDNRPENGKADVQCFDYDSLRRMTSAWTPGSGDCTQAKSVATLGGAASYWHDFTFDKIGNRKTQVQHTASGDVTETYTVPASGATAVQPHTVSSVTRTGPTGNSLDEFTYDPAGNVKTRTIGGDTQTLDWSPEGRVSGVTEADGTKSEYLYDAGGNRLLKKEPHATTLYLPGQELVLTKSTATLAGKRYYSHGGSVVAMRTTVAGLTYVLTDHHGTDEVSITASNLYVSRRYMDPFGERRGTAPSFWPDDKGFVGGVNDATGLVSIGAREYDPVTGRFVSADPILDFGDPQQVHGYAYANNAPATSSDPSGLFHIVDQEGRYRSNGRDWTPAKDQNMKNYYNGNKAIDRTVDTAKTNACAEMGLSSGDCGRMQADAQSNRGFWDVIKEELPDIIGDLTGFNDLRDCFTKFNLVACAGVIPWARVLKLLKSAGRVFNAVRKALKWEDRVSAARALMTRWSDRVNDLVRKGMDKLNDLLPTKAPSCVKHSFPPGTRVLLADGSSKPIERVELGDAVLASDQGAGRVVARKVVVTWVHDDEPERTEVTVDTDGAAGDETATLTGTDWHPVWEPKLRAWVPLANLQAGSWLQTSSGSWVQATAVRKYHGTGKVHDLTVEGAHTYHVLAGTTPVLVHNCGDGVFHNGDPDELPLEQMAADFNGVSPISAGSPEFGKAIADGGDYLWTVGQGGNLNMVRAMGGIHHTIASGGSPVVGAGQVTFEVGGKVRSFDNHTGHYTPKCAQCAASSIDQGSDAFARADIRVPLSAIKNYFGRM